MHKVTIMSKPGCHLCDVAKQVVERVIIGRAPAVIEILDITQDQELLEKYKNDIPVVLVDGVERFRHTVDADRLAELFYDEPGERLAGISS